MLVFSADNGGIGVLGNNYPLRGHKHDPWEGGTRVTAFLSGGVVPAHLRGTNSGDKLVHISGANYFSRGCGGEFCQGFLSYLRSCMLVLSLHQTGIPRSACWLARTRPMT